MLSQAGITHTDQLLASGGTAKGRAEIEKRCGINERQILKWVNMSDLFRVKGVAGCELKYLPTLSIERENRDNKYSPAESRGFGAGKREG